jgi:hypothetical protein
MAITNAKGARPAGTTGPVPQTKAEPTLAEACAETVHKAARVLVRRCYGQPGYRGITEAGAASHLWQTSDEGRLLKALSRSKWGRMPKSKALAAIAQARGSADWAAALAVLRDGVPT